jgi:hypothetical protein
MELDEGWTLDQWYHKYMPIAGYSVWHSHTTHHGEGFTTLSINRQVYNPGCVCLECGEPAPIEIEGFIKLIEWGASDGGV